MSNSKYSLYELAKANIHFQASEWEKLGDRLFLIGKEILSSRIIDEVAGTLDHICENSTRILDSSWLYFALDSFYCRRKYCPDSEIKISGSPSIDVPAGLDGIALWSDSVSESDSLLVNVAQGKIIPWENDCLISSYRVAKTSRSHGAKLRFLKLSEQFISICRKLRLISRPRIGILGLHHLVTRDTFGRLVCFMLRGGAVFGEYFKHDETAFPINIEKRNSLRQALVDLLITHQYRFGLDSNEILALASYLSIGAPVSHFEGRHENWRVAHKVGSIMTDYCEIFTAIGLYYSTYQNFLLGVIKQRGGEIVGIQHGGYYGYMKNMVFHESVEMQCSDRWLSWGWNRQPSSKRIYRAQLEPIGSHYLFDLNRKRVALVEGHEILTDRVLFCATDFPRRMVRMDSPLTSQYMSENIWPYSVDVMVNWLKRFNLSLDLKPYAGFFSEGADSEYIAIIKEACKINNVPIRFVNSSIPARHLMPKYKFILWDTIGTGFFESIAMGCCTLLVPAASICPIMTDGLALSEEFYLSENLDSESSFQDKYRNAMNLNHLFVDRYGKQAECDFFTFLKTQM